MLPQSYFLSLYKILEHNAYEEEEKIKFTFYIFVIHQMLEKRSWVNCSMHKRVVLHIYVALSDPGYMKFQH